MHTFQNIISNYFLIVINAGLGLAFPTEPSPTEPCPIQTSEKSSEREKERKTLNVYHGDELVIQLVNSVTFSLIVLAMSLSPGYFSLLLRVSASVCCFGAFACIAWVNSLYSLSVFYYLLFIFFICCIKWLVLNAALLLPTRERSYCRCYMTWLDCFLI